MKYQDGEDDKWDKVGGVWMERMDWAITSNRNQNYVIHPLTPDSAVWGNPSTQLLLEHRTLNPISRLYLGAPCLEEDNRQNQALIHLHCG